MGFPEREWRYLRFMRSAILVCAALVFSACPDRSTVDAAVEIDAGSFDAGVVDAGPPLPLTLEPTVTVTARDAGTIELKAGSEADDVTSLTITIPVKLKDFRLRLMDWRDQIVPSDDELMPDGKTYVITLSEPLKTGRGYALKLDAELGPVVTDDSGAIWDDWELAFRIAGDVQPEPGPKKSPKRKR